MARMIFGTDNNVVFDPGPHTYTNSDGREFRSVSRILNSIEIPFDAQAVSLAMSKGDKRRQAQLLAEWKKKGQDSLDKGNFIHDNLEEYHKLGTCDEKLKDVVEQIKPLYSKYYRVYSEVMLSDQEYAVAGQTDLVVQRQRSDKSLFDFYDYKTNQSKGIEFDSIRRKKDPWQHYNKFFLPPLDHLEDCNYTRYSLQLSIYAYLAQRQYGINIGRLALIFIDNDLQVQIHPVAYLRFEAEALLRQTSEALKSLPGTGMPGAEYDKQRQEDNQDW